jgi:hypothetical protein
MKAVIVILILLILFTTIKGSSRGKVIDTFTTCRIPSDDNKRLSDTEHLQKVFGAYSSDDNGDEAYNKCIETALRRLFQANSVAKANSILGTKIEKDVGDVTMLLNFVNETIATKISSVEDEELIGGFMVVDSAVIEGSLKTVNHTNDPKNTVTHLTMDTIIFREARTHGKHVRMVFEYAKNTVRILGLDVIKSVSADSIIHKQPYEARQSYMPLDQQNESLTYWSSENEQNEMYCQTMKGLYHDRNIIPLPNSQFKCNF